MTIKQRDIKKISAEIVANIFRYMFFLCVSYVLLYPFIYIIVNSVKSLSDTYDATVNWVPKSISFDNIRYAFTVFNVKSTLMYTILYEIVSALIQFCSCAIAAYGVARFNIKGKGILTALMIASMLVPPMMLIIPD